MKHLVVFLTLMGLTSINAYSIKNPTLKQEISKKMILDLRDVNFDQENDFVFVSLSVNEGQIKIEEITGNNASLIDLVKQKLGKMKIKTCCDNKENVRFHFTFDLQ